MPSAIPPNPRVATAEDRNADYDAAVNEFLKDIPLTTITTQDAPIQPQKNIDEEIVIKKKRNPVPKLDSNLLLSTPGLPKLRKITKQRLRFRGKGHEFSDISHLLNTYQLWLDDLFPRAKFRDALGIVEKVGHGKRMQVMRRAWLDGTKPYRREDGDGVEDVTMGGDVGGERVGNGISGVFEEDEDIFGSLPVEQPSGASHDNALPVDHAPDDDELDALLAEKEHPAPTARTAEPQKRRAPFDEESENEDDLDALLAEETSANFTKTAGTGQTQRAQDYAPAEPDFADDEEAMASMDMW